MSLLVFLGSGVTQSICLTVTVVSLLCASILIDYSNKIKKRKGRIHPEIKSHDNSFSIIPQIPVKQREHIINSLNTTNNVAENISLIFKEYNNIFSRIECPSCPLDISIDQAFRDLVRERVELNNSLVQINSDIPPAAFQSQFLAAIKEVVCPRIVADVDKDTVALIICRYLSRTRSGGDSLFALRDLFSSSEYTIIASSEDHAGTGECSSPGGGGSGKRPQQQQQGGGGGAAAACSRLLTSSDGRRVFIFTTSVFHVYRFEDLNRNEADDDSSHTIPPLAPLATFTVSIDETILLEPPSTSPSPAPSKGPPAASSLAASGQLFPRRPGLERCRSFIRWLGHRAGYVAADPISAPSLRPLPLSEKRVMSIRCHQSAAAAAVSSPRGRDSLGCMLAGCFAAPEAEDQTDGGSSSSSHHTDLSYIEDTGTGTAEKVSGSRSSGSGGGKSSHNSSGTGGSTSPRRYLSE